MSAYINKVVTSIIRIPGGYRITEVTGKQLEIRFTDGMKAADVGVTQSFKGHTRRISVKPRSRKATVYTFDRTVPDPQSDKGWKQHNVSIGRLIAECEAILQGCYSPTCEYNHKLRVADFRDLHEPERVGTRWGELVTPTQNSSHDNLVTRVLEDTGIIISVAAVSQAYKLLALNKISVSDVLKFKHIKHTSPTGKDWYEILV